MTIKELFESTDDNTLTLEQFETLCKEKGLKFADLSDGKYVSKSKYESDLKSKDGEIEKAMAEVATANEQIENLNSTIATRDNDLADLQEQLKVAGEDATKLEALNNAMSDLQAKYEADVKSYQDKMAQQAYEFAVDEYSNTIDFSSQAAKRDFRREMIARGLQMEDGKILGRDDFADKYFAENTDARRVVVEQEPTPSAVEEVETVVETTKVPELVAAAPGYDSTSADDGGFSFNFTGVRAH